MILSLYPTHSRVRYNEGFKHSLQLFTLIQMISMLITVPYRSSSAVKSLQVDGLKQQAYVTFKNGNSYAYGNVSRRAILNVLFNPDVSLGFWVNNNLVQSDRVTELNGDEFDYEAITKRNRLEAILNDEDYPSKKTFPNVELPQLA